MIDISKIKTYSLKERKNKIGIDSFAKICSSKSTISDFVESLPQLLAADQFRELIKSIKESKKNKKPIIWGLGAHVIKTGLSPLIINLIEKGFVSAVAFNGAGPIHDAEISLIGESSEEVADGIKDGTFGMVEETGELINSAIVEGDSKGWGFGESIARKLIERNVPYKENSILVRCLQKSIPSTVHLTIGTDITNMHPNVDPAALGRTSYRDFLIFCSMISKLTNGGVYLNIGSAVTLPEVFLKAITISRNLGFKIGNFTVACLDFNRHYRSEQNVIERPSKVLGCKGMYLLGHHELMIPLLTASLLD